MGDFCGLVLRARVIGDYWAVVINDWQRLRPVSLLARRSRARRHGRTVNTHRHHRARLHPATAPRRTLWGSVTAAVAQQALAGGKTMAFLYNDLRNPFSNRCNVKIGYRPVCDS